MIVRAEIFEQPAVLAGLLETQQPLVEQIARAVREREVEHVLIAGRGTSGHAGVYAQYLWGMANRLPVSLAAPSMFTAYGRPPSLKKALVVGISQSGQSPDIVRVVQEGRAQGGMTLAITNDSASPLARASEWVADIRAGKEAAVAATKTYTAELMVLAMLSVALERSSDERAAELRRLPELVRAALEQEQVVEQAAADFQSIDRCIVLGRGYSYATALEWALKLKEMAAVAADPYSSAEFQHGPIALVGPGTPVLAIATGDPAAADLLALLKRLASERSARLLVIGDNAEAVALAECSIDLPAATPPWLGPLVQIAPAQLFGYHLARSKGLDPDTPPGLKKVTLTR